MNFKYEDCRDAIENAGQKMEEPVLDRAANDENISFQQLRGLVRTAYPDKA